MTAELNWDEIEILEITEGLTSMILAPIILPVAAALNQPLAKKTVKEAITFSQRCKEALAEAKERIEDVLAEAQADLEEEPVIGENHATIHLIYADI